MNFCNPVAVSGRGMEAARVAPPGARGVSPPPPSLSLSGGRVTLLCCCAFPRPVPLNLSSSSWSVRISSDLALTTLEALLSALRAARGRPMAPCACYDTTRYS
jgi:hypothetical protein